ncbi:exodeoxyribonuclease VII large subunit [Kordiimonas sp. SCSIO 12603]|uniref:exodeoxyribonuclease VII large subunit n=1 Tax=Kordiimonas sp. SCSIO 12603 TaxID=2829596 RepID=UPI0021036392|nr:exodeoxyribonuclease VII large subunit [Kordiimonas sp. SCSIO 12603]UTW59816.1 exodeoxyribonuclease VII large subunit [Kordiimonas sp. SCSIO 12603]
MASNEATTNAHEFTVSELSGALKRTVEDRFGYVRVRAELSGVKRAASGHIYFALKDDSAVMDGVMWRGSATKLSFVPEDGLEVVASGKLTTYPARSKYQMVVDRMEPAGAGALMALLEERKKKLAAEGLFNPDRKKPIPFLPRVIGVVTSPTGAVIRDILHRLNDRFPRHVMVWPVLVQGEGAADQVAKAIEGFNAIDGSGNLPRPDLLIVARGGGSIEDLWGFNEEAVVRAAAASDIPLISAVGHETDTTLIDYASDLRAPTPTGAAEMAVPVREELNYTVADLGRRLSGLKVSMIADRAERVKGLARGLPSPRDLLGLASQRFDELSDRLPRGLQNVTQKKDIQLSRLAGGLGAGRLVQMKNFKGTQLEATAKRLEPAYERKLADLSQRLNSAGRMLESLSYERVLDRGFALVEDASGKPVASSGELHAEQQVSVRFKDGTRGMKVLDGEPVETVEAPKPAPKPKAKPKAKPQNTNQGSLF